MNAIGLYKRFGDSNTAKNLSFKIFIQQDWIDYKPLITEKNYGRGRRA